MKVKSRGAVVKNPRDAKVKISKTVRLDGDLVSWLVSESDRTGIPYQTLMNSVLEGYCSVHFFNSSTASLFRPVKKRLDVKSSAVVSAGAISQLFL